MMFGQVKKRFWLLLACALCAASLQAADPRAEEILRSARLLQSQQHVGFSGQIRNEDRLLPFRLYMEGETIRYVFADRTLALHFGKTGARLEEQTRKGSSVVGPARFDQRLADTDISYEDLTLGFLYWPNAVLIGEDSIMTQRCWKLQLQPGSRNQSHYSRVILWVDKNSGALMRADSYNASGELAKRFEVRKAQKIDDLWVLKQMKIQELSAAGRDKTPTYLEIQEMLKPVAR